MFERTAILILNKLGEKLFDFYVNEVFIGQREVKILIDDDTFYEKCNEAIEVIIPELQKRGDYIRDIDYNDFLIAFDMIYTKYNRTNDDRSNKYIALAIAVYQVLLTYREVLAEADNEREGRFYRQLRENYPSLERTGKFYDYFEYQENLWETVRLLFSESNKNLEIPNRRIGNNRYVQFPNSQQILSTEEINSIRYTFRQLDYNRNYSIEDFNELYQEYSNRNFAIPLIFRAYKSWKYRNGNVNAPKANSGNSSDIGSLYFYNDGVLYDESSEKNFKETIGNKTVYFYKADEETWCSDVSENKCDLGVLISSDKIDEYSSYKYNSIKTQDDSYIFLSFSVEDIKNTPLYTKFYPEEPVQNERQYKILDGIRLNNNNYIYGRLPKIVFSIPVSMVEITLKNRTSDNFCFENNTLELYDYLGSDNKYYKGEIKIKVPRTDISININMVSPIRARQQVPKGWDLSTMAPCRENNITNIHGLNFYEARAIDNNCEQEVANEDYEPEPVVAVPVPYVNCNFVGPIRLISSDVYNNKKIKINNFLKNLKLGNEISMAEIICGLRNGNQRMTLSEMLSYYRLIKLCILERYFSESELFIIYYVSIPNKNPEEASRIKPIIKKVTYVKDFYDNPESKNYFDKIIVNGKRPMYREPFKISVDYVAKSIKTICHFLNFQCEENIDVHRSSDYGTDYIEYYEVLLDNKANINVTENVNLIFNVDLSSSPVSEIRSPAPTFNFDGLQKWVDDRIIEKNTPLETLQNRLYKFIQIKGVVTWRQITEFVQEQDLMGKNLFDLFFPLYNVGLIDVCWNNNCACYYVPKIRIATNNPVIGVLKSQSKFAGFRSYPNDYTADCLDEKQIALSILQKISSVEDIIRNNWTKVTFTDVSSLQYGFHFGSSDGIDLPGFRKIKEPENFVGLCRKSKDRRLMAREPSYLKFSNIEIYQVPSRNNNPNAERLAKIVQRSFPPFNELPKRLSYNKESKELTCHISDIPIPVLRALFRCNLMKLGYRENFFNIKERNKTVFTINDEIYKELKRILNNTIFQEIENVKSNVDK